VLCVSVVVTAAAGGRGSRGRGGHTLGAGVRGLHVTLQRHSEGWRGGGCYTAQWWTLLVDLQHNTNKTSYTYFNQELRLRFLVYRVQMRSLLDQTLRKLIRSFTIHENKNTKWCRRPSQRDICIAKQRRCVMASSVIKFSSGECISPLTHTQTHTHTHTHTHTNTHTHARTHTHTHMNKMKKPRS
jgi:hypothetical protein